MKKEESQRSNPKAIVDRVGMTSLLRVATLRLKKPPYTNFAVEGISVNQSEGLDVMAIDLFGITS